MFELIHGSFKFSKAMHSIVILGDSRYHEVSIATTEMSAATTVEWSERDAPPPMPGFFGGAKFFYDAAKLRLGDRINIFTYKWPRSDPSLGGYAERREWYLKPESVGGTSTAAARLFPRNKNPYPDAHPPLSPELVEALLHGKFEPPIPDVSCTLPIAYELSQVQDDLGSNQSSAQTIEELTASLKSIPSLIDNLRAKSELAKSDSDRLRSLLDLRGPINDGILGNALSIVNEVTSHYSQICQVSPCPDMVLIDDLNLRFRDIKIPIDITDTIVQQARTDLQSSSSDLRSALILLLDSFRIAQDHSKAHFSLPIMEPVIIASVVGNPANAINQRDDKNTTFLGYLYNNPWLRQRCTLLLNAADLQSECLPISSGLSWERTAQEVIAEIKRSSRHRRLLEFGQLIIRFRQYGLLYIVRHGDRDWSYKLVFDTKRDDSGGTHGRHQGVVLGESAVVACTLVEELVTVCNDSRGNPLLSSLPEATLKGASIALARLQRLNCAPYGHKSWRDYITLLRSGCMLPQQIFAEDTPFSPDMHFSQVSVPPILLRDWSILGQTVQTRLGEVAKNIVRFGVTDVLNQEPLSDRAALLSQWSAVTATNICNMIDQVDTSGYSEPELRSRVDRIIRDAMTQTYDSDNFLSTHTAWFKRAMIPVTDDLKWMDFATSVADTVMSAITAPNDPSTRDAIYECIHKSARPEIIPPWPGDVAGPAEPVAAPVLRYGTPNSGQESVVVDRREIEGYRAIEKLLRSHIARHPNNRRPLCIAVFGPPGSGKSTAVRRINESLNTDVAHIIGSFNLSQWRTEEHIKKAFEKIREESTVKGKAMVPIAFFDEFDCQTPDKAALGWLKYFLGPMEEGKFEKEDVSNAVLVFAGGTKTTFNDFSLAGRSRDDQQWVQFAQAKGPDFVSRLRGHLNIVGINPADPDDELYLIRRAIMIRSVVAEMQQRNEGALAKVDENLLRAILHVPMYWHGGRSLRMLLEQCDSGDGLTAYEVPPIQQLNMLVDGKAFLDLLNNVQSE